MTYSTRSTRNVGAPRAAVYRALLDPAAVAAWRVPAGMRSQVHEFDARQGGRFRVSLTYEAGAAEGKSGGYTDTYQGHFVTLVPDELVVESIAFESSDPAVRTPMTMTTSLVDSPGGGRTSRSRTRACPTPSRGPTTKPALDGAGQPRRRRGARHRLMAHASPARRRPGRPRRARPAPDRRSG